MIGLFVRLKLRLLRNVFRQTGGAGLVVFSVLVFVLGMSGAVIVTDLTDREASAAGPVLAAAIVFGWLVGPILFGASDETIDTSRLALFSLDPRPLATGMAAASVVGPGPVAALLPLAALALRGESVIGVALGLAASLATILLATTGSRLALTQLGASLRQRRSRDLATLVAGLAAGVVALAIQLLAAFGRDVSLGTFERAADAVRITPLGWSGDAIVRASRGEVTIPVIEITATVVVIGLILRIWVDVIDRALSHVEESEPEADLGGHLLRGEGEGPSRTIGTVLAKERRYLTRHPRYRVQVVSQLVVLVVGGAPFLGAVIDRNPESVLLGAIPGLTAGVTGSNLFGPDGRAFWSEAVTLEHMRPLLRGRSLAFAVLGFGATLAITLAAALWTGGWQFALPAIGAGAGMALAGAGVGSYTSTLAPTPYPDDSAPNPFATATPGAGCVSGIITMVGVMVGLMVCAPIIIGLAAARSSVAAGLILALVAPLYGAVVWLITTHLAGRRADRRIPEIVRAFTAVA